MFLRVVVFFDWKLRERYQIAVQYSHGQTIKRNKRAPTKTNKKHNNHGNNDRNDDLQNTINKRQHYFEHKAAQEERYRCGFSG